MIELTKDDMREFERLKTWCAKCPAEAAMRIEQLDSMLSINTNIMKQLKLENERYQEVLERIKKSYPVGNDEFVPVEVIYEIQMIIDKALKGESNETSK